MSSRAFWVAFTVVCLIAGCSISSSNDEALEEALNRVELFEDELVQGGSTATTRIDGSVSAATIEPESTTSTTTTTTTTTMAPPSTTMIERVEVPDVIQQSAGDARVFLARQALLDDVRNEYSWDVEIGLVIRSEPVAGTWVDRGTAVRLIVSAGRNPDSFDLAAMVGAYQFFVYMDLMGEPLVWQGGVYDESDWGAVLFKSDLENRLEAEACHNGHVDRWVEFVFDRVFTEELGLSSTLANRMLREPLLNPSTAEKFFQETQGGFYIERITDKNGVDCPPNTWSTRILITYEK